MSRIPWDRVFDFSTSDLVKFGVSAAIIVLVSKIQLVSDRLSALPLALPVASIIAMVWMHHEGQSAGRLANHAESTFWFVLPTLPMFLILPWMLRNGWGFWPAMAANCGITLVLFRVLIVVLRRFGTDLMPG